MQIIADTHVHTIASEHAFSTLMENCGKRKQKACAFLRLPTIPD